MVKKSVRNYSFLLFSVLLLVITAIAGLFLLSKTLSNKAYAQAATNCTASTGRGIGCSCEVLTPNQCANSYCGGPYSSQTTIQGIEPYVYELTKIMGTCQILDTTKTFCPSEIQGYKVTYACSSDRKTINATTYTGGGMQSMIPFPCPEGTSCTTNGNACAYCAGISLSPTVPPTVTTTQLSCDPDKTGASLNKINNADFIYWLAEFLGTKTSKDADCKTDQIIDIFDFNKLRDLNKTNG